MLSKKDTYRNYGIWVVLILFYFVFYYLSNHGWVNQIDLQKNDTIIVSHIHSPYISPHIQDSSEGSMTATIKNDNSTIKVSEVKSPIKNKYVARDQVQYPKKIISINTADQKDWESLYNIGPYRAERIMHFRKVLGGFYSVDQVGETYGLPDSVFQQIKLQLKVEPIIDPIMINHLSYDSLYQHPYITKQMAYFIARHREKESPFQNMNDLYAVIKEKDHEKLIKLEPYLDFRIR